MASNLGISVTALNDAFRAARKGLITAQIDKAQANGDITAAKAAQLKSDLDDASLPGYKSAGSYGLEPGRRCVRRDAAASLVPQVTRPQGARSRGLSR